MELNYSINWVIYAFVTKHYKKSTKYQKFPITWLSGIPQSYWPITILKYIDCYLFLMEVVSKKKDLKSINCLLLWSRFLSPATLKSGGLLNFTPAVSTERPPVLCVCPCLIHTNTVPQKHAQACSMDVLLSDIKQILFVLFSLLGSVSGGGLWIL